MIKWELPIKTVSEANMSEHWSAKSKRRRQQQFLIRCLFRHDATPITLPCTVKMTRIGIRECDSDNLVSAFKGIRDEISEYLIPESQGHYINKKGKMVKIKGRADSDPRINWEYAQEKGKSYGVRIEIY